MSHLTCLWVDVNFMPSFMREVVLRSVAVLGWDGSRMLRAIGIVRANGIAATSIGRDGAIV